MCMKDFIAAHTVSSEACPANIFKQSPLNICLYCVMYLNIVSASKFRYMIDCSSEQFHIVIVEWSGNLVKLFYCIDVQHIIQIVQKRLQK